MLSRLMWLHETLVLDHPRKVLAVLGVLLVLALIQIPNMFIETSSDTLVLEGDNDLQYYREVRTRYPESEFLLVSYAPIQGNLADAEHVRSLTSLVDALSVLPGVRKVNSIIDVPLLTATEGALDADGGSVPTLRDGRVDVEVAAEEFRTSPLYRGLVSDEAFSTAAVQVLLVEDKNYWNLFNRREALRTQRSVSGLSEDEAHELERVEQEYIFHSRIFQDKRSHLIKTVRNTLDQYRDRADIFLGGVPMITSDMVRFVRNDLVVFGILVGLIVLLFLVTIFRDWRWIFVPLLCCAGVVGFSLGLLIWIEWPMTIVSANFLLLLFILTLSLNVHLIVRYRELQHDPSLDGQRDLLRAMLHSMRTPCTYMIMTTVVSFVSLYFSQVRPVIDFGLMMALSCSMALVWTFLLFPATLMLLSVPKPGTGLLDAQRSFTRYFSWTVEKLGTWIVLIYVLALAVGIYGLSQLRVESRFIDYFGSNTDIYQGMEVIDRYLGGTIPLEVVITMPDIEGSDEDDDFDFGVGEEAKISPWMSNHGMKKIKQVHNYLDSLSESGKVLSLSVLYDIMEQYLGAPPDDVQLAVLKESLPADVQKLLVRSYLSEDGMETRIALRVKETSRDLERGVLLRKIRADLEDILAMPSEQVGMTGLLVLYNNLLQSLYRSQILTIGVVTFLIFMMFAVLFRSALIAALAVLPNILAATLVIGGMGLAGIPLDMVTVVIGALVIGIGVDDTVHYVWRFKTEFEKDRDYTATMHRCHGSVGRALSYTSLTIVVGLMPLLLSNFNPSVRFGALTAMAMIIALIGTLVLLPQVFKMFQPFGKERIGLSPGRA